MPILVMPTTPKFSAVQFKIITNSLHHTSSLDGTTQTVLIPGPHWMLESSLPPMLRAAAEEWLAFLADLDGMTGRFYAGDPLGETPRGVATGTPLVNGASQAGTSLVTDGWTVSITGILRRGDYLAYDTPSGVRMLHKLMADANSDGAGNATLSVKPAIRESPANNQAIITASPTCVMRLIDNDQAGWEEEVGGFYRIAFAAIESFNTG